MDPDTYRQQLFQKITACRDEKFSRSLVNDAASVLQGSKIGRDDQIRFWRALKDDLDGAKRKADHDALTIVERQSAAALSQVIAAAQAAVAQHHAKLAAGR